MTRFVIRDDRGVIKAAVDATIMAAITKQGGKWRAYATPTTPNAVCFEWEVDMTVNLHEYGVPLTIYIWKGDILVAGSTSHG